MEAIARAKVFNCQAQVLISGPLSIVKLHIILTLVW